MIETPDAGRRSPAWQWHRPLMVMTAAMAATAVLTLFGVLVDDRVLAGEPVWLKPFKFALSIGVYTLTWAWMLSLLPVGRRVAGGIATFVVVLLGIEVVGLVVQAFRGRRSHFNKASEFDTLLGNVMGISAALILLCTLALAVVFFIARITDTAAAWAIRLGALLSVAGMAFGPLMGSETEPQRAARLAGTSDGIVGGHSVGVPDGGPGMPLTGWSTVGGDLRVPHLIGIHALQVLPIVVMLLGLLARRYAVLRLDGARVGLVWIAAISYAGLIAVVGWQAFRGQSLIRPDGATGVALGALLFLAVAGSVIVLMANRTRAKKYRNPIVEHASI